MRRRRPESRGRRAPRRARTQASLGGGTPRTATRAAAAREDGRSRRHPSGAGPRSRPRHPGSERRPGAGAPCVTGAPRPRRRHQRSPARSLSWRGAQRREDADRERRRTAAVDQLQQRVQVAAGVLPEAACLAFVEAGIQKAPRPPVDVAVARISCLMSHALFATRAIVVLPRVVDRGGKSCISMRAA